MTKSILILITIFLAGLIILLLPDNNDPIIRFNKIHGPSLQDLGGLVLIISVWFVSCIFVMVRRGQAERNVGQPKSYFQKESGREEDEW